MDHTSLTPASRQRTVTRQRAHLREPSWPLTLGSVSIYAMPEIGFLQRSTTEKLTSDSDESNRENVRPVLERKRSWQGMGEGLPGELVRSIEFFRRSEFRTFRNERLHHLCTRAMMVGNAKAGSGGLADDIVRLKNLFEWRKQQRLKVDWFLYVLRMTYPTVRHIDYVKWSGPVAKTFKIEKVYSRLCVLVPDFTKEQFPDPSDMHNFPLHPRDMEYKEPILQLASKIANDGLDIELVLHEARNGKFIFGSISEESVVTVREQLTLNGREDEEDVLRQRKRN
ncbi:uncharacterized protein V1513DRAFT_438760 [Lipomyces chichibuensis]|uniref:uncharacterized protein n=1 Tax=Lipomyces chichibuensis TaxID=1546026 RepID=UPI00334414CE